MSQILRPNEYVKIEVHFSYKVFVLPMLFMSIGILLFLMVFSGAVDGLTVSWLGKNFNMNTICTVSGILLLVPYIYKRIDNRLKIYAVTNQRVYIKRGIINIQEKDIPISQINDVQISQSLIQRMFGAADVVVQVGNDESRIFIEDVNRPREFRDTLINAIYEHKRDEEAMKYVQEKEMDEKHKEFKSQQQHSQQHYKQDNYPQQTPYPYPPSQAPYSPQNMPQQPYPMQPPYPTQNIQQNPYPTQNMQQAPYPMPQFPLPPIPPQSQPQYPQQSQSQKSSYNQSYQDDSQDYEEEYDDNDSYDDNYEDDSDYENDGDYGDKYEKPFDPDGGL